MVKVQHKYEMILQCLTIHYNGSNSLLFVNATKIYQFEAKDSEIKKYSLRLGNISRNFSVSDMKR